LLVKADATAYNLVTQCYDDIKASPLRSAPEAAGIEREINATLLSMRNCAQQGDLANIPTLSQQIRHLIAQRNLKLKNISNY
jgi:hypothetical protein